VEGLADESGQVDVRIENSLLGVVKRYFKTGYLLRERG
jgi:hypothetical protein